MSMVTMTTPRGACLLKYNIVDNVRHCLSSDNEKAQETLEIIQ